MTARGVRVVRAAEARRMPWKNGGGTTTEYATHPPGAGLDVFAWRLSTAQVEADGPFSPFPGTDRTLTILDGAGLALRIGDTAPVAVTPDTPPLSFPADVPTTAALLAGPVLDLNIMTRRSLCGHAVRVMELAAPTTLPACGGTLLLFCRTGQLGLEDGTLLAPRDLAIVAEGAALVVAPRPLANLILIEITVIG